MKKFCFFLFFCSNLIQASEKKFKPEIIFPILTNHDLEKVKIIGLRQKPNQPQEAFKSSPKNLGKDKLVLASLEGYEKAFITAVFCSFQSKGQIIEDTFPCKEPIPLEDNAGISITIQKNLPCFVSRTKKGYVWSYSFYLSIEPLMIKNEEQL